MFDTISIRRFFLLISITILLGVGCPLLDRNRDVNRTTDGAILTQGPPPADCGRRRANRFLPYFRIENPEIVLGESIRLDASCSVGEIVSLRWDFDFEAWPENTPGVERFEPEISIDVAASEINNTGPFYQVYTPANPGTHTARLFATDARGTTHLVIHTYIVHSDQQRVAAETELNPRFNLTFWNSQQGVLSPTPEGDNAVYIPQFQIIAENTPFGVRSGTHYYAYANGTTGPILKYKWDLTSLEPRGGLTSSTPLLDFESENKIRPFIFHTGWALPLGAAANFGRLGWESESLPENTQTADFSLALTITGSDGREKTNTQRYRLTDTSTVRQPIAQMSIRPETTLSPGYPMRINNVSLLSVIEVERTCRRGQCSARLRTPETVVEIDSGTGQYQEVGRLPAGDFNALSNTYGRFHSFGLEMKAPQIEGGYTARLRLTQINAEGSTLQKETSLAYTVRGSVANYNITVQPASARVGENVTFTARPTVSVPPLARGYARAFGWQLSREGEEVDRESKVEAFDLTGFRLRDRTPHIYQYRFRIPGTYELRLTVAEGPLSVETGQLLQRGNYTVSESRAQITISGEAPPPTKVNWAIPNIDVVPVGIAIVPGLTNPIYENDDILYRVRDLSTDATLVQWDYTNDGSLDTYCQVRVMEGFATCSDERRPAPQPAGNFTARVRVAFRGGRAEERTVNYSVTVGERRRTDQLGRPVQSAPSAETVPAQPEYIQIFVNGRSSPLAQTVFPAGTSLGFYAAVNASDSAITAVRWDFDGNGGPWDNECVTPTPDGRQLICNIQHTVSDLTPGTHRATVFVQRNDGPDISLQRAFDIEAE